MGGIEGVEGRSKQEGMYVYIQLILGCIAENDTTLQSKCPQLKSKTELSVNISGPRKVSVIT